RKGRYGLLDYEKMFCPDFKSGHEVFAMRGIDRKAGCMVVVRPDQYVGHVLPLDDFAGLAAYFDGIMLPACTLKKLQFKIDRRGRISSIVRPLPKAASIHSGQRGTGG
ncbi:hypothetical protein QT651_22580, partial [Xanthomonas citri pv. citri]